LSLPLHVLLLPVIQIEGIYVHEATSYSDEKHTIDYLGIDLLGTEHVVVGRELLNEDFTTPPFSEVEEKLVNFI
jgi:hypothetical protein